MDRRKTHKGTTRVYTNKIKLLVKEYECLKTKSACTESGTYHEDFVLWLIKREDELNKIKQEYGAKG